MASIARDPFPIALCEGYLETLDRLRRSFVRPDSIRPPQPLSLEAFTAAYPNGGRDSAADAFRRLEKADAQLRVDPEAAYARYQQWLPFAYRQQVVLGRVADRLGYDRPDPIARAAAAGASTSATRPTSAASRNVAPETASSFRRRG